VISGTRAVEPALGGHPPRRAASDRCGMEPGWNPGRIAEGCRPGHHGRVAITRGASRGPDG